MMIAHARTLRSALDAYLRARMLGAATEQQYSVAIKLFCDWHGGDLPLSLLTEELVANWLRWFYALPRSPETVRRKRGAIITIWRHAADLQWHREPVMRRIPCPKKLKRIPTSWTPEEMRAILEACERATLPARSAWGPPHWVALTRTAYDTSHRLGALLKTPMHNLNWRTGELLVGAESTKQSADTLHRLSHATLDAIRKTGDLERPILFPWANEQRYIYACFRRILKDAGLPAGRRDLFHKIRRSSYTEVCLKLGKEVAGKHAGHNSDMSEYYFDTSRVAGPKPIDVIPAI